MQRNFGAANKTVDRALEINPTGNRTVGDQVELAIAEKGDFSVYEQAFEKVKSLPIEQRRAAQNGR